MKSVYQRENLKISEFDAEDVITTSGLLPDDGASEKENAYGSHSEFENPPDTPGPWF